MSAWNEVSNGKLEYVRKRPRNGGDAYEKDIDAWDVLYDQYTDAFGHHEKVMKIRKHKHNIANLQADFNMDSTKYKFNKTLIGIELINIEEIEKGMRNGMTIHEANVYVSKFMDARGVINFKTISVFDYYTIVGEYDRHNKQLRKDHVKANS